MNDIRKQQPELYGPRPPKVRAPRDWRRDPVDGKMECFSCREMVPISEYYVHRSKRNGRAHYDSYCNPCRKMHMILRYVGLTREQYIAKIAASNGLCEVCQRPYAKPSIDHCHTTGIVRGVLCIACNSGIGQFKNSPETLRAAADYLERYASADISAPT